MAEQWQIRRGTTQENDDFVGAEGELSMDTQRKEVRLHDGTTQGGFKLAKNSDLPTAADIINAITPNYLAGVSISSWPYTFTSPGWVRGEIAATNGNYGTRLQYTPLNGSTINFGNGELSSGNYANTQSVMFIVEAGGTLNRTNSAISAVFYPMKGLSA